ncbi:Cytochrome c oxidase (cbb3-type) subunit CcoP [hydrothermal vent metagenome]|uniref:Cytochrome c oxidase subunit III n=1 Tax=hydrothermal vent metagenome TaxID=652676 RepID=A0A3B0RI51_9ZZZZ
MSTEPEYDEITKTYTTGHEWDGIKELNTPLPRWWLWVLYATIIWSIGYWILMPAWPMLSGHTKGYLGYSQRDTVNAELQAAQNDRKVFSEKLLNADLKTIENTQDLLEFAMAGGKAAFGDNCAGCHGSGAAGAKGYPNLNDDDWLWGGTLDEIHHTITVGIRGTHDDTRLSDMPAFLSDEILDKDQIRDMATYVRSLSDKAIAAPAGTAELFQENCAACHGENAKGNRDFGAPNLTDGIWLYGSDPETLITTISYSRKGVMPTWAGRLDPATIRSLAVFVHTLGGGE